MNAKKNKKQVVVTRKWLMDFADKIYNPKTKEFLSLCNGTLQNGPDPENPKRTMHCGLGELYFELTGNQPKDDNVNEEGVIYAVVKHSSLMQQITKENIEIKKQINKFRAPLIKMEKQINKLIPKNFNSELDLKSALTEFESNLDFNDNDLFQDFRIDKLSNVLNEIPDTNDDGSPESFSMTTYKKRSRAVAHVLRRAARLLP